jgi:hypothetical protein
VSQQGSAAGRRVADRLVPDGTDDPQPVSLRAVVLVEGISDKLALEALAERRGRRLGAEGVSVV